MLLLSANISLLYPELPFLERVGAAASSGFSAVEVMYPYAFSAHDLAKELRAWGLTLSVLNAPPGNYTDGERGLAALPGRENAFKQSLHEAVEYAHVTQCTNVHVLTGNLPQDADERLVAETLHSNLNYAATLFDANGLMLLLEPLSRQMLPAYSLTRVEQALERLQVLKSAGHTNVGLQLDLYHTQMEQGNLAALIQRHFHDIEYVQIAGVPGRHEPTHGEINYRYLLELLQSLGFAGWVGCEYIPQGLTDAGLDWARDWGLLKPSTDALSTP
ncbi:hydroxypyruvate isomerase family protein [Pusillimonas sp. ANT_WB101]|uniref:hydroxypyruvate isomerase family protein n=1 Tax=Pusillimonas sp. ANT_WB101 TaxID=2597356 RepID=UPI0011ED0F4D|nr:TIM barrel protein [Pusillimonas sp. ANT_WB101]KAA0892856.1 TIM barrel protein [Pusillimonas sp. ANT_WB101]